MVDKYEFLKANSVFESGYIDRHPYAKHSTFQCQKKALKNSMKTLIEKHKGICLVSPIVSYTVSNSELCYYILFEDGDLYSIDTSPNHFGLGLNWTLIDQGKKDYQRVA